MEIKTDVTKNQNGVRTALNNVTRFRQVNLLLNKTRFFLHCLYRRAVLEFCLNVTLNIFARVCLFHVFSKSGSTINTNFKHHFQIIVAFGCFANTITLSNMHIGFIALNLGTPDRFRKGDIISSFCCHAVSQPSEFLNRRMFVQRIRQHCLVSCRNFGGTALMRYRNIAIFAILCIFW